MHGGFGGLVQQIQTFPPKKIGFVYATFTCVAFLYLYPHLINVRSLASNFSGILLVKLFIRGTALLLVISGAYLQYLF